MSLVLGALAAGLVSGVTGFLSSKEQEKTAQQGLQQQREEAERARVELTQAAETGQQLIGAAAERAGETQQQAFQRAQQEAAQAGVISQEQLQTGQAGAEQALQAGTRAGLGALQQGFGAAAQQLQPVTQLQQLAEEARGPIQTFDVAGQAPGRVAGLLEGDLSRERAFEGFQQDPGFQFRLQQGEQAINRAAAARGGRVSGRTLKELQQFGQGLASQEFGAFAQRRAGLNQQQLAAAGAADQQRLAALTNQAGREDRARLAAQQGQLGLAQVGFGAAGQLAGLAAQQGQQAGAAQFGLGQQLAQGRQAGGTQQSQLQQQLGQQQVALGLGGAQAQAGLDVSTAQQQAQLGVGAAQAGAGLSQALLPQFQAPTQFAGQGTAAIGGAINSTLQNLLLIGARKP